MRDLVLTISFLLDTDESCEENIPEKNQVSMSFVVAYIISYYISLPPPSPPPPPLQSFMTLEKPKTLLSFFPKLHHFF